MATARFFEVLGLGDTWLVINWNFLHRLTVFQVFVKKNTVFSNKSLIWRCPAYGKMTVCALLGCWKLACPKTMLQDSLGCILILYMLCADDISKTGTVQDRQRSGRPRVTSRRQDNYIRTSHLRNRFQSASLTARSIPGHRRISPRTVRNRLREANIRPRRPRYPSSLAPTSPCSEVSVV